MKKVLGLILVFVIVSLGLLTLVEELRAQSYSYYENFSGTLTSLTNNGWRVHTVRGRSGIFPMTTNNHQNYDDYQNWYSAFTVGTASGVSDSSLIVYGRANNCQLTLNNYWAGNSIKFIPASNSQIGRTIVATPETPFGFTVVHRMSRVDNLSDHRVQRLYHRSAINIWIAEENYKTNTWENYDNFVLLYQEMESGNTTVSEWGYYKGGRIHFNLASGVFYDNWGNSASFSGLRVNMQDNNLGYLNMNFYGGNAGTSYANTSVFGIKVTHDGSKVSFYFNPQPYASAGSWYKVGETGVGWYSNIVVEFGHDSLIFVSESQEAYWDDFTIRTVTSNTTAYILQPTETVINATNIYTVVISNDITVNDSGVGEIKIVKPAGFGAWDTNAVWVETYYITGADTNNRVFSGEPLANQFLVRVLPSDPNSLLIRFRMASASDNAIIRSSTPNRTIRVSFRLVAPSVPDIYGNYKFGVYVDCSKIQGTGTDIAYATTGWKKAREVGAGLSVKVYNRPYIFAGLSYSPTPMYEGDYVYSVIYNFSTSGISNNPDIGIVEIAIPSGFVVSNAFKSLIVPSNYIFLTNYGGTNRIRVDYRSHGSFIPGVDGLDRLEFYITQTPDLPVGVRTSNFVWPIWVYDKFGTSVFLAGTNTNATYRSQRTEVVIISPQALVSIFPPKVNNAVRTNTFAYNVINGGPIGNDIIKLFILFDTNYITNHAWGFSNNSDSFPARISTSNIVGLGFGVFVEYTNSSKPLRASSNDIIYFTTVHRRNVDDPPVIAEFVVYADNGNTEGLKRGFEYNPNSWKVLISPPDPEAEAYIFTNKIDTTVVSFAVTNHIFNVGASGNNIRKARIRVPSGFVIRGVSLIPGFSWLTNSNNIEISGNNIILHYDNEGVGLRSVYENPSYQDRILITLSNTNYFTPTVLTLQTFVSNARGETNARDKSSLERQILHIEWPDVRAWVSVYNTNTNSYIGLSDIDSSLITNVIFVRVSNLGANTGSSNIIYRLRINIPTDVSTNVFDINSSVISNDALCAKFIPSGNYVFIDYQNDETNLRPGGEDIITFKMVDFVETSLPNKQFTVVASNQKAYQQITNGSWTLNFKMPRVYLGAKFEQQVVYTSTTPTNVNIKLILSNAGFGSNRLYRIRVLVPPVFTNRILGVSSSIVGTSGVVLTPSNFTINYVSVGTNLPAGFVDEVMVMFSNTFSSPTNGEFIVIGSNGQDYTSDGWEEGTNVIYSTNDRKLYISERPLVNLTPYVIYTTTNTNTLVLTISNGTSAGNKEIHRVGVVVPTIFGVSNISVINTTPSDLNVIPNITIDTNNRLIIVTFASEKLRGGKRHSIQITAIDNFNYGETNVVWDVGVDYGDGYSNNNFAYPVGGSNSTFVKLPPSRVYGKLIPNDVYFDLDEVDLQLELTNYGESYNDVYWVRVYLPNIVTNVVIISNRIPARIQYLSASNVIFINYFISNTNLPSKQRDIIYFTAYDSIDNNIIYSSNLVVQVANYPSNVYFTDASQLVSGDLTYRIANPPYRANYRIEPNIVSAFETGFVTYRMFVDNAGNTGHNARVLSISYPFVLITNDMVVSNTYGNASVKILTNRIIVEYTNSSGLPAGASDIIYVHARDNWVIGDTNVSFSLRVKFDTSGGKFVKGRVVGGTNVVYYISSPPYAYVKILYRDIYYSNPKPTIMLTVSNGGSGDNIINRLDITIPSALRIGFNVGEVSSVYATNISYSSGVVTLLYGGLHANDVDTILIPVSNTNTVGSSFELTGKAYNGVTNAEIIPTGILDTTIRFISLPTVEILNPIVSTFLRTNEIVFKVENNVSGDAVIKNFRISLRWPFTNVIHVSSSKPDAVASVSNATNVYISYSNGIGRGDYDLVTVRAQDVFNLGVTNTSVMFYVNEGVGYVVPNIGASGSNISLVMPPAQGYASLVNKYVLLSTVSGVPSTNLVRIVFTNTGDTMNNVTYIKVVMPKDITNFITISNSLGNTVISNVSNVVFIHYTNDGLLSKQSDLGWFVFENYYSYKTNIRLNVYYDNGLGVEQFIDPPMGQTLTLLFDFPETPADYNIVKPTDIAYTIDTNHTIILRLANNSYSYPILNVKIPYHSSNYTIVNIRSSNNYVSSWVVSNGELYLFTSIPTRRSEYILIDVVYNSSLKPEIINTTNDLTAEVYYDGGERYESVNIPSTETSAFKILYANFGRVIGLVKPHYSDISVRVLYSGSDTIATNIFGENILSSLSFVGVSNNVMIGRYRLDFVPPGTYDILITSSKYRFMKIANVVVPANTIINVSMVVLSNAPFSTEAREEQSAVSLDDGKTMLIVPPGSLLNDFSVDIIIRNATGEEQSGVMNSKGVGSFNNLSDMKVYEVIMRTVPGENIFENPLKSDVILKFYYDENYISSQGWSESKLSVWYWKDTTREWVRIGGQVDMQNNFVYIKTRYLHRVYAVMGDGNVKKEGVVRNVKASPNPFTPNVKNTTVDNKYGMLKITFELDKPYDKYQVKIYDVSGRLVRVLEGDGSYGQGEVYWDGKDHDGVYVRNGAYLYVVVAGGTVGYRGTIILVK
ncbi:MAG: FlgD immunoglobulin-like domain containing protein [Brevinematia bacterium]